MSRWATTWRIMRALLALFDETGERLIGAVLAALGQRARLAIYGGTLLLIIAYGAAELAGLGHGERGWRALAYGLICAYETIGVQAIRGNRSYHPAYKIEKGLGSGAWALIAAGLWLTVADAPASPAVVWGWLGLILVAKIAAMEFILRRNRVPVYEVRRMIKTTAGLVPTPALPELVAMCQIVAGAARHDDIPPAWREILKADLGHPTRTEMAADLRRQIAERRERMARAEVLAPELELDAARRHPDDRG